MEKPCCSKNNCLRKVIQNTATNIIDIAIVISTKGRETPVIRTRHPISVAATKVAAGSFLPPS